MTDLNYSEIEKQAKEILDKFAKALEKVDKDVGEIYVDREDFERTEKDGEVCDGFKRKLLENLISSSSYFSVKHLTPI